MATQSPIETDHMLDLARAVRDKAYAPYSQFKVGAVLRTSDGQLYAGCNVENVAYPEGTCAEAGAIAAMIAAQGHARIASVLVIADRPEPVTPCGGCRQKLAEFGDGATPVYLANMDGVQRQITLGDLLPGAFSQKHMDS